MNTTVTTVKNPNAWKTIVALTIVSAAVVVVVIVVAVIYGTKKSSSSGSGSTTPKVVVPDYNGGVKLVGTGAVGQAYQGHSVAMSGDGLTAAVGAPYDNNSGAGAVYIYVFNNGTWSQQGSKIVPTLTGLLTSGFSVALSNDGNTLAFGAPDATNGGVVWVYVRSGGVWTEQYVTPSPGTYRLGCSVALSSDGNTMVAGANAYSSTGASYVYKRAGTSWTLSTMLVGPNGINQGYAVAISEDASTIGVGDPGSSSIWVFKYANSVWNQVAYVSQGTSLGYSVSLDKTGSILAAPYTKNSVNGYIATFTQASNWNLVSSFTPSDISTPLPDPVGVALTSNGQFIIYGNTGDNSGTGATWLFQLLNSSWVQIGTKIVGPGSNVPSYQGCSVAVSSSGLSMITGGYRDNTNVGAAWVFNSN